MDEVLRSRRRHMEYIVVSDADGDQSGPTPTAPVPPPSQTQQELVLRQTCRSARWDQVRSRRASGYSIQHRSRDGHAPANCASLFSHAGATTQPTTGTAKAERFVVADAAAIRGVLARTMASRLHQRGAAEA